MTHASAVLALLGEAKSTRSIGNRWIPASELLDIYRTRLRLARSRGADVVDYERVVKAFESPDYTEWRIASVERGTNRYVLFISKEIPQTIAVFRTG
jgi:hypothetical protein